MPSVAVDSSILYALFDAGDRAHGRAAAFLATPGGRLVSNVPVLTEVARDGECAVQMDARVVEIMS